MLKSSFQLEGRHLPITLPQDFEDFYRVSLRMVTGSRMKSTEVMSAYTDWAKANGRGSITFASMRKLLEIVGHSRVQSNGVRYNDIGLAVAFPDISDTLPKPFRGIAPAHSQAASDAGRDLMLGKVDVALAALLDLRRAIEIASDRAEPHVAARRALGLFDQ
ncbi:conserved hypothetical protein [Sphingomonas sp. EC-HK361]|uniref:hypothetical protein n=1 Tax=Sphingomonas sp. EC-HK361 TaxID=2038397 RepID=UPI00125923D9|nr:hypothetical protein [Sphingomonas sp. EC-HK361]VVT16411.1 conserved hypothetical protein [Sphingomonas sp. EC-HK361]